VFDADPLIDPTAKMFTSLAYIDVLSRGLKVMDSTAISLCMDNDLPIIVFNLKAGNIVRVLSGEEVGTLVHAGAAE
jgi:uridylate kinase